VYACFIVPAIDCICVRIGCTPQLRTRGPPSPRHVPCRSDSPVLFTGHATGVTWPPLCFKLERGFRTLLRQTLLSENRQCCESWRDGKLGVRGVCTVRHCLETRGESVSESPSDTTGEDPVLVRWVVLPCFHHSVTLPWPVWRKIRWPHPVQVLIATTTDAKHHRPSAARPATPAVRSVAVVYLPRRVCCSAPVRR